MVHFLPGECHGICFIFLRRPFSFDVSWQDCNVINIISDHHKEFAGKPFHFFDITSELMLGSTNIQHSTFVSVDWVNFSTFFRSGNWWRRWAQRRAWQGHSLQSQGGLGIWVYTLLILLILLFLFWIIYRINSNLLVICLTFNNNFMFTKPE